MTEYLWNYPPPEHSLLPEVELRLECMKLAEKLLAAGTVEWHSGPFNLAQAILNWVSGDDE